MGKFLMRVPTQMAGSCTGEAPASTTLNRMDATRLMVGHITRTVQPLRTKVQVVALGVNEAAGESRAQSVAPQVGEDEDEDPHVGGLK